MTDETPKYSIESYQSGTTWLKSTTGLKLHCGYWDNPKFRSSYILNHRSDKHRDDFVHALATGLNEIVEADGVKPYVLIPTITYVGSPWWVEFEDLLFGKIELNQYKTGDGEWEKEPIPSDFWRDLEALVTRVKECDNDR